MNTVSYNRNPSITPQRVAFKATPKTIIAALEKHGDELCPCKEGFLYGIVDDAKSIQKEYSKFKYRNYQHTLKIDLNQENPLNDSLDGTRLESKVSNFDEYMHEGEYQCDKGDSCSCGRDKTRAELAIELLKHIGVKNPEYITVKRQPGLLERLFTKKPNATKES